MPGLGSAGELMGAYPDRLHRADVERFPLEGAAARAGRLAGAGKLEPRLLVVLADRPALGAASVLAGFSVRSRDVAIHVCGPELTLELRY